MSRTARIVLAATLSLGALVAGGVALAANPAPAAPSSTAVVEQGGPAGLRPVQAPAQDAQDPDCPAGAGTAGTAAIQL